MAKKKKNRQERRAEEARLAELKKKSEARAAEKQEEKMQAARARAMAHETGKKTEDSEAAAGVKADAPAKDHFDEKAAAQASKEKRAAKKAAAKKEKKEKRPGFFRRIGNFFSEVGVELKKVNWLSRDELMRSSGVVFGIVIVFTVLTWLVDSGFGALAALFLGR